LSWIREVRSEGLRYKASFYKESSCVFTVTGLKPNHTLISPKAGIKASFYEGFLDASLNYVGEFGKKYRDNNLHLKLDFNF
jgi:uncharacterized protein with beta-barrel porin domain